MTTRRISNNGMQLMMALVAVVMLLLMIPFQPESSSLFGVAAWIQPSHLVTNPVQQQWRTKCRTTTTSSSFSFFVSSLSAKRKRKQQQNADEDDLNRWYESVNANASPDDIFWEEMERQRLLSQISSSASSSSSSSLESSLSGGGGGLSSSSSSSLQSSMMTSDASSLSSPLSSPSSTGSSYYYTAYPSSPASSRPQKSAEIDAQRSAEATLAEYAAYAVSDNWLDEELVYVMSTGQDEFNDDDGDDYNNNYNNRRHDPRSIDDELDAWEAEDNDDEEEEDDHDDSDRSWMQSDEPWDQWGEPKTSTDMDDRDRIKIDPKKGRAAAAAEFLFEEGDTAADDEELAREEAAFQARLAKITIHSKRLERAKNSSKAKAFFSRAPDATEGYDRLWVAAIDNVCFKNLVGTFRNYGIQFADNFGDWRDGSVEDGFYSIEDVASYKARKVFEVTGLPCIASRTMFEIEPIPNLSNRGGAAFANAGIPARPTTLGTNNPRVASGYRFNDVGIHVDYICEAMRPLSEPSRVTQFKTCLCFYDGEMEVFDYGVAEVDLIFSNSLRTFIPVAQAINEMMKTLELTFGLEYMPWLNQKRTYDEASRGSVGSATLKLRDRVLKEAKVLPNDIIDVSAFMDSKVDVELMDECAKELANKFLDSKPTKILTVATTGLVIALPMAKYLQVPVVYARKERNIVMADTYKAGYSSKTVGKNRELLVSKDHLDEDDRILVIDDFLSSGASQEALLRIISDSGATAVGVGVLLEKVYDSGRQSLAGFNLPIHSLCRVASVSQGVIQLYEEEGFDRMTTSQEK